MVYRGQPPRIVWLACGSLRANRAVTLFAVCLPLAFAVFVPVVPPCSRTATPTHARAVIHSIVPFHSAPFTFGGICFSCPHAMRLQQCFATLHTTSPPHTKVANRSFRFIPFHSSVISALAFPAHAQRKKSASPAEIGSRPPPSLSLRASCCQRPCSARSRLAPVPCPKLPIFRYAA